jgi:hypothetical protein
VGRCGSGINQYAISLTAKAVRRIAAFVFIAMLISSDLAMSYLDRR